MSKFTNSQNLIFLNPQRIHFLTAPSVTVQSRTLHVEVSEGIVLE